VEVTYIVPMMNQILFQYIVERGEAVLHCVFESRGLNWFVHNGGSWNVIADGGDVIGDSKYSTSKNPSTGLYYRLHIRNVEYLM
jgi:hypothetical protein